MVLPLFNILQLKYIKLAMGYFHVFLVVYLTMKIVILTICNSSQFSRRLVKTVFHGTKSMSYLGPIIWDVLPVTYKKSPSLGF